MKSSFTETKVKSHKCRNFVSTQTFRPNFVKNIKTCFDPTISSKTSHRSKLSEFFTKQRPKSSKCPHKPPTLNLSQKPMKRIVKALCNHNLNATGDTKRPWVHTNPNFHTPFWCCDLKSSPHQCKSFCIILGSSRATCKNKPINQSPWHHSRRDLLQNFFIDCMPHQDIVRINS